MMTQPHPTDEFSGEEFGPGKTINPYLQVIHDKEERHSGFFLADDNAQAVNFSPDQDWSPYEAHLGSDIVPGFRSLSARIVVIRRTPLLMFHRRNKTYLGVFDANTYNAQKASILLKSRYLIYLVSKDKKLLHSSPLQFTAKGSFSGSFGQSYSDYRKAMVSAYGQERGDRFFALCVFPLELKPVLKGKEQKSYVCTVKEFGIPTSENWKGFFLGYSEVKDQILQAFDAHADFENVD